MQGMLTDLNHMNSLLLHRHVFVLFSLLYLNMTIDLCFDVYNLGASFVFSLATIRNRIKRNYTIHRFILSTSRLQNM